MYMQRVGEPQPITKLDLTREVEMWIIYNVSGEVVLNEVGSAYTLEEVRRHMELGATLVAWQDGKPYVGTLQMASTLSPAGF